MDRKIRYLESLGFRVVPVHEGLKPTGFLVVNTSNKIVAESKMLCEAENFVMGRKQLDSGIITYGSAAELRTY